MTKRGSIGFNLRDYDIDYYQMEPSIKTEGVLPINKKGLLAVRCKKAGGKCRAKARMKFLKDVGLLQDLRANWDEIRNPDNWDVVGFSNCRHICEDPVEPYFSDRVNIGREYAEEKLGTNDHCGKQAWKTGEKIKELAARDPINFFQSNHKPGLARKPLRKDSDRLTTIYRSIHQFSLLSTDDQLESLRSHLMFVGGQRRINCNFTNRLDDFLID